MLFVMFSSSDVARRTTRTPISHPASGPVWLNKLRCRGDESHIIQCPHTIMPNCDHSKDVILKCGEYTGACKYTVEKTLSYPQNFYHRYQNHC